MAGKLGIILNSYFDYGETNGSISSELNELTEVFYNPTIYDFKEAFLLSGSYSSYRMPVSNTLGKAATKSNSFYDDYYNKVHLIPNLIDFETVVSNQTEQFFVWNSFLENKNLSEIQSLNDTGISLSGQSAPYVVSALQELTYEVSISTVGPPAIDGYFYFIFSDAADPLPLNVIGTRAIQFDLIPEMPVIEKWNWVNDTILSFNGTEQRISLKGEICRVNVELKIQFDNEQNIRDFNSLILTSQGRLWLPEYQYGTLTTQESLANDFDVHIDDDRTDIREGENILIQTKVNSGLFKVETIASGVLTLSSPLTFDVPKKSNVIPGAAALIANEQTLNRYQVNNVAEASLKSTYIRQRETLDNPNRPYDLTLFKDKPVLDKIPIVETTVDDTYNIGQKVFDNKIGIIDLVVYQEFTKLTGKRKFKIDRILNPDSFDFFKSFLTALKGVKPFWLPTYRTDLILAETPTDSAQAFIFVGSDYGEKIWLIPPYKFLEIETKAGIHRTEITNVQVDENGNSVASFETQLPPGIDWTEVYKVSYLLPCCLNDEDVILTHYGLESEIEFSFRTVENV